MVFFTVMVLVVCGLLTVSPVTAQGDIDDVLGGFDEPLAPEIIETEDDKQTEIWGWTPNGSLSAAAAYSLKDHRSSTGTNYSDLSKLRFRANLGLDRGLGENWRATFNAYAWYDAAYTLRHNEVRGFTDEVRDEHEDDFDVQDAYIEGKLGKNWDIRIGRQVVVWGFSDNLRVLDFLNPLDNLEPGLADIEDLRRPVGMVKLDHFIRTQGNPWRLSLIAIPEQRFSRNPAFGSDFYAVTDAQGNAVKFGEESPDDFEDINTAISLKGQIAGFDLSLISARHWQDQQYLDVSQINRNNLPAALATFNQDVLLTHSRITTAGFGVQKALGSWLLKYESTALLDTVLTETEVITIPFVGTQALPLNNIKRDQYHALIGFEYFGLASTTIAFDMAFRYIDKFTDGLALSGLDRMRNETALRITRDFMNERLRTNLIVILFDDSGQMLSDDGGAIYRLNATYELAEAMELSGGVIVYEEGGQPPFNVAGDNDRLFAEVKWSF